MAQELNSLKDCLKEFEVSNILTDPNDLEAFKRFEESGIKETKDFPDLT